MTTLPNQPGNGVIRTHIVAAKDRIHQGVLDVLAHCRYGSARALDQVVEVLIGQVIWNHQHTVHGAADDRLAEKLLALAHVVGVGDDHIVAKAARHILHRPHQRVVERVADVGDHHGDQLGLLPAQDAGVQVGLVTKLLDGIEYACPCLLANGDQVRSAAEHARDGALGHVGEFRHITHGDRPQSGVSGALRAIVDRHWANDSRRAKTF